LRRALLTTTVAVVARIPMSLFITVTVTMNVPLSAYRWFSEVAKDPGLGDDCETESACTPVLSP
jgi:hypothetical protein